MDQDFNRSGIYLLINQINKKVYVGKANNFKKRFQQHKRSTNLKCNYAIVNAIKKYGWENFEIQILEVYPYQDIQELLDKETYWIKYFDSTNPSKGYNFLEKHMDWTGKKHSEETKEKMSQNHADYSGQLHPRYGTHHSELSKRKMSEAKKQAFLGKNNPFWGKTHSEETKEKMKQHAKTRDFSYRERGVKQLDPISLEVVQFWSSAKKAALSLSGNANSGIGRVCRGELKTALGFKWSYV